MINCSTLSNGTQVITQTVPHATTTAIGIWILNGSRHQRVSESGYAHFLEHLLFKGSGKLNADQLAVRFEAMGGNINAQTGKELTLLHGHVPAGHAGELLDLFMDMLVAPRFSEHDLTVEKEIVFREMAAVDDDPEEKLGEAVLAKLWSQHPISWPILGTKHAIKGATVDSVRAYLADNVAGRRLWVVAVGGVDHAQFVARCGPLSKFATGDAPRVAPPSYQKISYEATHNQTESCLQWYMPAPLQNQDKLYYTLAVANHILGGGTSSRLFKTVREDRGLVYDIHSASDLYSDCGLWSIHTSCDPDQFEECRDTVERTVDQLGHSGPSAEELGTAKSFILANLVLEQNHLDSLMERVARQFIYGLTPRTPNVVEAALKEISTADVKLLVADAWSQVSFGTLMPR